MTRQETIDPRNSANRNIANLKGRRQVTDWSTVADFDRLPDWALIGLNEVGLLTGMSRTAIERRVAEGVMPAPRKHGQNRVWALGAIRAWCRSVWEGEQ